MYRSRRIKVLLRAFGRVHYLHTEGRRGATYIANSMARSRGLWAALLEVEDPAMRDELALVATAMQVHFANRAARERSLVEFMAIRFQWPASRTRRRLQSLVDLGVLRCSRDLADNWTKVFEVVDRPHVPAVMALELGA